jgi:WD40 repeat protein
VWDVAACPHGTYLVSGGADRTARLWNIEHARPLRLYAGV